MRLSVVRCEGHRSGRRRRRRPLPAGCAEDCWGWASSPTADAGAVSDGHELTAVVNVGDDAWMHGVRICPDLDTCMYTLGGGIDPERGWGHRDETWHAKEELAAYGVQPDWFGLGDRDLATHLVRSQMLRAGYPLSAGDRGAVRALVARRATAARHRRPQRNPRRHHRSRDRRRSGRSTSRSGGCATAPQVPTHSFAFVGAENATAAPGCRSTAITDADVVFFAPSNPVVSIGAILAVPGIRGALRVDPGPGGRATRRSSAESRCAAWPTNA